MLKNDQTYFKNLSVWKHRKIFEVFLTIFQHNAKGLKREVALQKCS